MNRREVAFLIASAWSLACSPSAPTAEPTAAGPTREITLVAVVPSSAAPASAASVASARASDSPMVRAGRVLANATANRRATAAPEDVSKERLVLDFGDNTAIRHDVPGRAVFDALLAAFPHPHAEGKACEPNYPGTPARERAGGILLPTITQVAGAFTRADASEVAFLIDYCPTGAGVPRTRRLLILDAGAVSFDHEFGALEPFDELLAATDLDGDGRAELIVTTGIYQNNRSMRDASLLRLSDRKPTVLGTWRVIEHCERGIEQMTTRKVFVRLNGSTPVFRDEAKTERCMYAPPPP